MRKKLGYLFTCVWLVAGFAMQASAALAQKAYDPGASDTTIKIGQTMPYSGPVSAYGTAGRIGAAYFAMLNESGGVNGRKIELISLDDGYNPSKTLEQVRRLVESDEVLLIFNPLGTAPNAAIQKYLNQRKVPQLFLSSGAPRFNDPKTYPWTMGWLPNYVMEGRVATEHLLTLNPAAKVGVLYQNDDLGRGYLAGIRQALEGKGPAAIVKEVSYEVADPAVDSQILILKAAGVDTFLNVATARAAVQAIRRSHEVGWKPRQYVISLSSSLETVISPAGPEASAGILSGAIFRDPGDPETKATQAYKDYAALIEKYAPGANAADIANVTGYSIAQTLVQVLKQAGDNLTRGNIMREAASLRDLKLPMLLPDLAINTGPEDFQPLKAIRLVRLEGGRWRLVDN